MPGGFDVVVVVVLVVVDEVATVLVVLAGSFREKRVKLVKLKFKGCVRACSPDRLHRKFRAPSTCASFQPASVSV